MVERICRGNSEILTRSSPRWLLGDRTTFRRRPAVLLPYVFGPLMIASLLGRTAGQLQQEQPSVLQPLQAPAPQLADQKQTNGATNGQLINSGAQVAAQASSGPTSSKFEQFKRSGLFVEPFDPNVLELPQVQVDLVRRTTSNDMVLFHEILNDAIESRRKFAPSVKLMFKYAAKLLAVFIRNRRADLALPERKEPEPAFFFMLADLAEQIIERSAKLKSEMGYKKNSIDTEQFRARVEAIFDYIQRVVNASPYGVYHRWDKWHLFTDQPQSARFNVTFADEAADLVAQFRAMGYESTTFVARRIVNLLRMFARGITPNSENEV